MKALAVIVLILLPPIVVQADCGRLTAKDNYEDLNQILDCLDSQIADLENRVSAGASFESGKAVSEGKPLIGKEDATGSQVTESEEIEPNNHISQATSITLGTTIRGRLKREDNDYYQFRVPEGFDHKIRLICRQLSRSAASFLRVQVFDSIEKQVAWGDGVGSPVSFAFSPEAGSTYFVKVGWQVLPDDRLDYELVTKKEEE